MLTYHFGALDGSPAYAATASRGRSISISVSTSTATVFPQRLVRDDSIRRCSNRHRAPGACPSTASRRLAMAFRQSDALTVGHCQIGCCSIGRHGVSSVRRHLGGRHTRCVTSVVPDDSPPLLFDAACDLGAPPAVVFAFIADHAALPRWIPGLRRVDVDETRACSPGGVGTVRKLHALAGPPGVEIVTAFEPPACLAYSATDESLRGLCTRHTAELSCRAIASGTRLRWTVRADPSPSWWKRVAARLIFNLACQAGLRNLRTHFRRRGSGDRVAY
jgi:hypothetical protein